MSQDIVQLNNATKPASLNDELAEESCQSEVGTRLFCKQGNSVVLRIYLRLKNSLFKQVLEVVITVEVSN